MRTASSAFLDHAANGDIARLKANLYSASGTLTALTEADFMEGFAFSGGTSPAGEFTVGGAVIGMFTFALNNYSGKFDSFDFAGAYIVPFVYYDANDPVKMGRYYIGSHKTLGHVINCAGYDVLRLMDMRAFAPDYPITAQAAVNAIAENHGITVNTFTNGSVSLPDPGMALTERQALAYIAGFTGNYAKADADGNLVLDWYDTSSPIEQETIFGQEIDVTDTTVTGVKFGENLSGTEGYVIDMAGNPFIKDTNASEAVARIAARVVGTVFRGGALTILANPALDAGDVIECDACTMIITSYNYRMSVAEDVSCDAVSEGDTDLRKRYVLVGADGDRGTGIYKITTAPSAYTTQIGDFTPAYRIALSTVKSQSGLENVYVGDILEYSYYHYAIGYVDDVYAYTRARTSLRGATGPAGATGAVGATGSTGPAGAGIKGVYIRNNWTDANWKTYGTVGRTGNWNNYDISEDGTTGEQKYQIENWEAGDFYQVTGTAKDTGIAYVIMGTVRSKPASGATTFPYEVQSLAHAEKGATGATGATGPQGDDFSWNILSEAAIGEVSRTTKGITIEYEGMGWWHVYGTVTGTSAGSLTMYYDADGLINSPDIHYITIEDPDQILVASKATIRTRGYVGDSTAYTNVYRVVSGQIGDGTENRKVTYVQFYLYAKATDMVIDGRVRVKITKGTEASPWTPAPTDLIGPQGVTGATGPQGSTGPTGATGPAGSNGKNLFGTSSSTASTATKIVDCEDAVILYQGLTVTVKFQYASTAAAPILNVNNLGPLPILIGNATASESNPFFWGAGAEIQFTYNGDGWVPVGHPCSYYGSSTQAGGTAAKTAAIPGAVVCKGTHVSITFSNGNEAASPTLNVSSTGAKTILAGGAAIPAGSYYNWVSLASVGFTFDGTNWVMDNTTDLYLVNGKNKVFYQATAPSSGLVEGDTWFDTANGYQLNKWDGTQWVSVEFGADAIAQNAIISHLMAGIITSDMISANGIIASKIVGDILSSVDGRNFFDLEEGYFRSEAWEEIGDDEELFGAAEIRGGTHLSSRVDDFVTYDDHTKTVPVEYGAAKIFGGALELDVPCGLGNTYPYAYLAPDGTYGIEVKSAYVRYIAENNYTTRKFQIECDDPIWIGGDDNDTWLKVTDSEIEVYKQLFAHQSIEVYNDAGSSPYIDFHRTGSSNTDYDSRLICNADGQLQLDHKTSGTKTRFTDGNIDMFAVNPTLYFHFNKASSTTARIEETSSGVLKAYNSIANGSDERLKKDIVEMDDRFLDLLDRMEPKAYRFRDGDEYLNLGFIAQDVIKAMTDLGIEDQPLVVGTGEGDDYYGLDYNQIIPILVGTVQKLKREVAELKKKVDEK